MQLVWIADCISYVRDGQFCQLQEFGRFGHAVRNEELLGGFSHIFMEYFSEITAV